MRHRPIRCTEWQEPVPLLRDERLLEHTGPTKTHSSPILHSYSSGDCVRKREMRHQRVPGSQRADTTLIPPGTQYGAIQGKVEQGKWLRYAGFASPSNPQQRLMDHS